MILEEWELKAFESITEITSALSVKEFGKDIVLI